MSGKSVNYLIDSLIKDFSIDNLKDFFREKFDDDNFIEENDSLDITLPDNLQSFAKDIQCIASVSLNKKLGIYAIELEDLTKKTSKKRQYDLAKYIMGQEGIDSGIFVFHNNRDFRMSFVDTYYTLDSNTNRAKSNTTSFKRFSYYVTQNTNSHTFKSQMSGIDIWNDTKDIKTAFSVEEVSKAFYKELSNWYFWALENKDCKFPPDVEQENKKNMFVIRMITRIIFIWFMREKGLIPRNLFDRNELSQILKDINDINDSYYCAILQNLFFAVLSVDKKERRFIKVGYNNTTEYGDQYICRYQDIFKDSCDIKELFNSVPFLNGGLFECHDIVYKKDERNKREENNLPLEYRFDGFSTKKSNRPSIPNYMFFGAERSYDFNELYGTKNKKYSVSGLFDILNRYNFTIDENTVDDAEIALDPELLGNVFENLLASFNPETEEMARKTTGSFYTPREIVDYMVTESLKEYILSKDLQIKLSDIDSLFDATENKEKESLNIDNDTARNIVKNIYNMKILDPACGSGAYPMGILKKVISLLERLDPDGEVHMKLFPEDKPENEQKKTENEHQLSYVRKLRIIQNCIYGVDIQPIAIEISLLRFFLSLLVDQHNDDIEPLPNLDFKLMQGNSLVSFFEGIDFDGDSTKKSGLGLVENPVEKLKGLKEKFLRTSDKAEKIKHRDDINETIKKIKKEILGDKYNTLKYEKQLEKEARAQNQYKDQESIRREIEEKIDDFINDQNERDIFPYKVYFAEVFEKGGFDIVIGNPPYIQLQKLNNNIKDIYKKQNYSVHASTGDIYCLFYEKGLNLLADNGILCYITSNKWMRAGYGEKLRGYLVAQNPLILIDLGPKVFETATVDTNILIVQKSENKNNLFAVTLNAEASKANITNYLKENHIVLKDLTGDTWFVGTNAEISLKKKTDKMGKPLKEWDVNINYGIKTGFNEAFIIDTKTKERLCNEDPKSIEILKPILRGKDIKRYSYDWAGLWLIATFPVINININNYPAVKNYLLIFGKEKLEQSGKKYEGFNARKKTGNKWFETQDQIGYYKEFEKEKIVWTAVNSEYKFSYIKSEIYLNNALFMITGDNLNYLAALFNSRLFQKKMDFILSEGNYTYGSKEIITDIPIPEIIPENEHIANKIEELVDRIISVKKSGGDSTSLENEIDQLVYKLYDLTPEEIAIVEGKNS